MKRSEMLEFLRGELKDIIDAYNNASDRVKLHRLRAGADGILAMIEGMGMLPPRVSEEDAQAIMSVYYGGYSLNQWDEDLEKDENVAEAKKRRAEAKARRQAKGVKDEKK